MREQDLRADVENMVHPIHQVNSRLTILKRKRAKLGSEKNELWRDENAMQQQLNMLNEEKAKKDQMLRSMVGKTILNGRESVRKVVQMLREKRNPIADLYYDSLIDNFTCEKQFFTAVEMTAGTKLFHHIVENDKVGTKILQEMNRMKLPGEVTFMPLNRLYVKEIKYPDSRSEAVPMIEKLEYNQRIEAAAKFVFGKILICRSLEVATALARGTTLDCITLDGDQVSHKGSLTGGYFDARRSRLELYQGHKDLVKEMEASKVHLTEQRDKLTAVESEINAVVGDMQKAETKNSKNKDTFDKMKTDIRLMRDELAAIERSQQPKERSLVSHEASLSQMESSRDSSSSLVGSSHSSGTNVDKSTGVVR